MAVPYTFGSATTSIPLSQLDSNFATTITLGNTAIQLGNTVTTLNNMTLTTPVLGTPASGTLTNCTGLPNAGLVNSSVTVGSTAIALGATATTVAGLTSLATNTLTSAASTALTLQSAGTTAITVDTSQNVGIGTASPAASTKLTINGSNDQIYLRTADTNAVVMSIGNSAGNSVYFQSKATGTGTALPFAWYMGGTQSMTLDSSGNLLVGTTSQPPSGTNRCVIKCDGSGNPGLDVYYTGTGAYNQIVLENGNGVVGRIQTSGSVTAYLVSSDYRLKQAITPITGALAKVAQLKPVTYKWNVDGSDGEGFIAHELAEVCPIAVSGEKDATKEEEYEITPAVKDEEGNITAPAVMGTRTVPVYQGIDTSFLIATLTAAIQELKAINDTQAETINALTARIVALEAK